MPFSSVEEFERTESPTDAERALIAACRAGIPCSLPLGTAPGQTTLPPEGPATEDRRIRAPLLRLLILGGTPACGLHTWGVWLVGAHVTEMLDLRFVQTRGQCTLDTCRFDEELQLEQAHFAQLSLNGSHFPGLFAQTMIVTGSVFLRGVTATKTVNINGANISGQVFCDRAVIDGGQNADGGQQMALNAQTVQIGEALFLRDLTATGTVNVTCARITGQLVCNRAKLDGGKTADGNQQMALNAQGVQVGAVLFLTDITARGMVDLTGANITGTLPCDGATLNGGEDEDGNQQWALNAQHLYVAQRFHFRHLKSVTGQVNLAAAHVGNLVDDAASWPVGQDQLYLNGFTYDRIGDGPLTLAERQTWLTNGSRYKSTFYPQPYTQFARVLREAGHSSEARKVLMERDRLLFTESHKANLTALNAARMGDGSDVGTAWLRHKLLRLWDWFSRTASGYGHAPQRALFWSLACIGMGAIGFWIAWQAGVMVPNSAIILTSPDWLTAMASNPNAPSHDWTALPPGTHYETFYALPYALDVFVPFVSLGQEQAWAATTVTWPGCITRWFTFAYQIVGWSLTALGIAAVTGFVQKNQPD